MWEDPGEKLQDGQMSATGQPKGHLGTLDFLKKVCIFPGILDAMAASACGCLTWVLVNGQMETYVQEIAKDSVRRSRAASWLSCR